MNFGGYRNRVAWVDLAVGESEYKPIEEENARKYIGGRGLGAKYVFDNGPQVEPLSPDNILCMMTGPLSGTDVNLSGRLAVCTKSPQRGKSVHETVKALQEVHGEKDLSVMTIGRAGENLVSFACIVNEHDRASGRGGTGAVMGSKNLKAVVVSGVHDDRPRPFNNEAFKEAHARGLRQLMNQAFLTSPKKRH